MGCGQHLLEERALFGVDSFAKLQFADELIVSKLEVDTDEPVDREVRIQFDLDARVMRVEGDGARESVGGDIYGAD